MEARTDVKTSQDILAQEIEHSYVEALKKCDGSLAAHIIDDGIMRGLTPSKVYLSILAPVQMQLTKLWESGDTTMCHEHLAAQISLQEMTRLRRMIKPKAKLNKRAVVAALDGDDHFVGPRLVADFLLLDGWDVDFLGASTPLDDLMKFISSRPVDLVSLSATNLSSVPNLQIAVEKLHQAPNAPKVIIGGSAVYSNLKGAQALGADGIAEDARTAVKLARKICGLTEAEVSLLQFLKGLGTRIVTSRKERNMSQQQLAELANLDRAYISALENGKQNVTVGAVAKLADALDVALEELLVEARL